MKHIFLSLLFLSCCGPVCPVLDPLSGNSNSECPNWNNKPNSNVTTEILVFTIQDAIGGSGTGGSNGTGGIGVDESALQKIEYRQSLNQQDISAVPSISTGGTTAK